MIITSYIITCKIIDVLLLYCNHNDVLLCYIKNIIHYANSTTRLAPMWQQSGTLIFCSCHGIAGFLVDELQIWICCHFLEVLSDMTLIFIFKKEYIIFVKYVF